MKWWKRVLLAVPKVGLAYRAYGWFRFVRRRRLVKITRQLRKLKKAIEEDPDMIGKMFKSKMVWLGILQEVWTVLQLWLNGGDVTMEIAATAVTGILTILLRFVTNKPLEAKESLLD